MPLKKKKHWWDFFVTTTVHYAKELNESHRVPYLTIEKKEWNRSWKNDKESKLSVRKTNKKLQEIP